MTYSDYSDWFRTVTEVDGRQMDPHPWQVDIGTDSECRDRLLRIPTGFGKTAGTVLPWLFHRAVRRDSAWPTRLVFCLPMRTLVEQTETSVKGWIRRAGFDEEVQLYVLLGGRDEERWVDRIDAPSILIGTQDMLLSRALNRGYGASRGLWPMEFGQLHNDALWVIDEVQLMDVGLATTAQLRAFREESRGKHRISKSGAVSRTWWMSATLQPRWLSTIDHATQMAAMPLPEARIPASGRVGGLWDVTKKIHRRVDVTTASEMATLLREKHQHGTLSLAIVNTVKTAIEVFTDLKKKSPDKDVDLRIVHGRFRGYERRQWADRDNGFLRREASRPSAGRIIVATQVIEAGVDVSASLLLTELAPWSSLVQRFGRAARYASETAEILVVGAPKEGPYKEADLVAAAAALDRLGGGAPVGPRHVEEAEELWGRDEPAFLETLYPYQPLHVLRRTEFEDLFDTSPDLSGADLDVGRFIRSGDERDVSVFWRNVDGEPQRLDRSALQGASPTRDELCAVPLFDCREFLKGNKVAYQLDYVSGTWTKLTDTRRIVPGMRLLFPSTNGGYDPALGWNGKASTAHVQPVEQIGKGSALAESSASADDDTLSHAADWKTIGTHGRETAREARTMANRLGILEPIARIVVLAGRWHDVGKAHEVFQDAIVRSPESDPPYASRRDFAKAPDWNKPAYRTRPGFRHELASTLMLFDLLRRAAPHHAALLGPHSETFAVLGISTVGPAAEQLMNAHPLIDELVSLSAEEFDLLAWLVCTHHGKVRCSWSATANDQDHGESENRIHGVVDGDQVHAIDFFDHEDKTARLPATTLSLELAKMGLNTTFGRSWSERVTSLRETFGVFTLAYLESLLRVADFKASRLNEKDELL